MWAGMSIFRQRLFRVRYQVKAGGNMDILRKLIKREHPDYDFDRHHFSSGDILVTLDSAKIVVEYGALDYVSAFVVKRGLKYRELGACNIPYSDLPYYKRGEFQTASTKCSTSLEWKEWEFRQLEGKVILLLNKVEHQTFRAYVLSSEDKSYEHEVIYVRNPFASYVAKVK